jgi:hypothetical protein
MITMQDIIFEDFSIKVNPELEGIDEGFIQNKLIDVTINNIIKNKNTNDTESVEEYLNSIKGQIKEDKYNEYIKRLKTVYPDLYKKKSNSDSDINNIEKRFIQSLFTFIKSEYSKLKSSNKYKNNKELQKELYIDKSNVTDDSSIEIASIGIDPNSKLDPDDHEELFRGFDDFIIDIEDIINKKYKESVESIDANHGREYVFSIDREKIPGNK